ncbi:hypothetical protein AURDEDRAFT_181812 [Auricularia subglabra TFB-10046 SS5]|nr:hypothetical protein AURDEDRAFT_181812 [Auricularia subglabra TFB-10046 SS5]
MTQTFSNAKRRALSDYITNYLHEITRDITDPRAVDEVQKAVGRTVNDTCSAFSKDWKERSFTPALPPEIFTQCLGLLPLQDLVSATSVCWAWRNRALSTPLLWNSCTVHCSASSEDIWLFSELLHRSRRAPFHLKLMPDAPLGRFKSRYGYNNPILGLVHDSSARLASYHGPTEVFTAFNWSDTAFPKLESFTELPLSDCRASEIPPFLWSHSVPRLRTLRFNRVRTLGPCSPFRTVFSLSLALSEDGGATKALFYYFPNLVSLEIRSVSSRSILPDGPFPPSLVRVSLRADPDRPVDYAPPLGRWKDLRVPALHVTGALSPLPVFEAFAPAHQQRHWTLDLGLTIRLSAGQNSEVSIVELHPRKWDRAWLPQMQPYTSHLSNVELRPACFLEFINSRLDLPDLETLTLSMEGTIPRELFDVEQQLTQGPIRAPELRGLVISVPPPVLRAPTRDALPWLAQCLPKLLRAWIDYDAEILEAVSIVFSRELRLAERPPEEDDFAELAALGRTFSMQYARDLPGSQQ